MGITPIERVRAWFAGIGLRCAHCKSDGETFRSAGGYRYCSEECEAADAGAQQNAVM